jgi:TonB-dependent starch-binding outer membrane protein SusC
MKIIFPLFLFLLAVSLHAQLHQVSGIVIDGDSGEGIIGVSISEKGNPGKGTITDIDGRFSLETLSPQSQLEFTYIGYKKVVIDLQGRDSIEVLLSATSEFLDEVVVVGYGTQKKKVVTGAIATIGSDQITATPVLRIEQALQGRAAGVQVTNLSGQPGEPPTVRIRGAGTTGNAEPLYIVDGMPVGGIDFLNPGDIESIDVLKDAASAAIYGARAANGVVLITTKSGRSGKMNVSYSGYYGLQNVTKKMDMLDADQYRMLMNEGARNAGLTEPFNLNEIAPHNTNWQDHLFTDNAPMANHELSITGGNDKSTYAASMSYFSQQGIIGGDRSQFDRMTARLNAVNQVNKKFKFSNNFAYTNITRRGVASNTSFNGPYSSALNMDPLTPLFEEDPFQLSNPPYSIEPVVRDARGRAYGISKLIGAEVVNPIALLELQNAETRVDKLVGNVLGELEIAEGLKFTTSGGIDLAYVTNDSYRPLFYLNGAQANTERTSVSKNISRFSTWQLENTLSYQKKIDAHNFSLLGGTTAYKFNFEDLSGFNTGVKITDPNNVYLNLATDTLWMASGGASQSALLSAFFRVNYDFDSRYSFTAVMRRDGSSRFGENNRFGYFPSLGAAWLLSEESFFPKTKNVDILKLRVSWGINGNQEIGDYQFVSSIDNSRSYIFNGGRAVGASPRFIENADIRWEQSEQIDIALDFGFFNNRLTGALDFYQKTTSGLLERIPIPAHVGNDPPVANVGSVQNRGVELSLNWRNYSQQLKYSLGVNMAYNQNRMTQIGNEEKVLPGASWAIAGMVTRAEVGLPIGYFWGFRTDGIFQNNNEIFQHINAKGDLLQPNAKPGDVRFVDVNGDGVIDARDRTMIGNPTPAWTFGFNADLEYKRFDFSMLWIGTYGNDIFNGSQRQDLRYTNRTTAALDRWTGEGTSNTVPRYTWIDANNNYRVSDLYIEDGSFLRLKNIQIGYNFSKSILDKIGAAQWRAYLSGENLLTITSYTGPDPEIGALSSFDIGIDRGIYPQARAFRLGTIITF